ncbi:hypothetical protein [Burkholderia pseudomultivorans]|uniref:hypothetical protein n=1 Tax=Burkholderia pseudomultivorans TaxID=1207504 RepID=UPI0012D87C14|nr:hypothetical protein [Burkholderia pseudomultivorans]
MRCDVAYLCRFAVAVQHAATQAEGGDEVVLQRGGPPRRRAAGNATGGGMTIHFASLEAARRAHPVRIADWGYLCCREADLAASGVAFFDDVEDPGVCRRAAFSGKGGCLVVLTVHRAARCDTVLFASDAPIAGRDDWLAVLPDEFAGWGDAFEVVYFGRPV